MRVRKVRSSAANGRRYDVPERVGHTARPPRPVSPPQRHRHLAPRQSAWRMLRRNRYRRRGCGRASGRSASVVPRSRVWPDRAVLRRRKVPPGQGRFRRRRLSARIVPGGRRLSRCRLREASLQPRRSLPAPRIHERAGCPRPRFRPLSRLRRRLDRPLGLRAVIDSPRLRQSRISTYRSLTGSRAER